MKFGLSVQQLEEIQKVLASYPEIEEAILFGSRAIDTYKAASDVDIALKGNLDSAVALTLKDHLEEETYLPFFFDLVAYPTIQSQALKTHIRQYGKSIYRKGWHEVKLGEVVKFGNGKARPKISGSIPIYGGNGILGYASEANYDGQTIIIGRVGAYCGSVYFADEPIWVSDNALSAKPKHDNDTHFLYYFLKNLNLNQEAEGSSHPLITQTLLNSLDVSLPQNIAEQKAIASVLSSLDEKIDLLHRQNKTLEAMAETLFRQWFVEEAQENWEWVELGQFVEVMRGLSYKGSGLCSKESGVPMHNLNSVYEGGGYKYEGIKYYSGDYKERHLVSPGDVIITNTEQGHDLLLIGFPAIVSKFFGDFGIFSQHIYKLRIKEKYISEPFLYYLLMSYDVREQITGATNGSTVNMLPKDGIEWAKFQLPPELAIKHFTNIIKPYLEKKELIHSQIHTLEKLRDTLLPKLMSGEVKIQFDEV